MERENEGHSHQDGSDSLDLGIKSAMIVDNCFNQTTERDHSSKSNSSDPRDSKKQTNFVSSSSMHQTYQDFAARTNEGIIDTSYTIKTVIDTNHLAGAAKKAGANAQSDTGDNPTVPTSNEPCTSLVRSCSFPVILHSILEQAEENNYDLIISWQYHGRAFHIHDSAGLVRDVMPHFFQQTRYNSFLRQLSLYGFQRIRCKSSPDEGCYYHEMFLRGMPHLASNIQRLRGKNSKVSPVIEPDFTKMSVVGLKRKAKDAFPELLSSTEPALLIPRKEQRYQTIRTFPDSYVAVPLLPQVQAQQTIGPHTTVHTSPDINHHLTAPIQYQPNYHFSPLDRSAALPFRMTVQKNTSNIISNFSEESPKPGLYSHQPRSQPPHLLVQEKNYASTELIAVRERQSPTIPNFSESYDAAMPLLHQLQSQQIDSMGANRSMSLEIVQQVAIPAQDQQQIFEYDLHPLNMKVGLPFKLTTQNNTCNAISNQFANTNEHNALPELSQSRLQAPMDLVSQQIMNSSASYTSPSSGEQILPPFAVVNSKKVNSSHDGAEKSESTDNLLPLQLACYEIEDEQAENADLARFLSDVDLNNSPDNT